MKRKRRRNRKKEFWELTTKIKENEKNFEKNSNQS